MLVYRFKPSDRGNHAVALTRDESGANLPAEGAPWQPIGSVDLSTSKPWINAPVADIEAAVGSRGYYIWSIDVPQMKPRFGR